MYPCCSGIEVSPGQRCDAGSWAYYEVRDKQKEAPGILKRRQDYVMGTQHSTGMAILLWSPRSTRSKASTGEANPRLRPLYMRKAIAEGRLHSPLTAGISDDTKPEKKVPVMRKVLVALSRTGQKRLDVPVRATAYAILAGGRSSWVHFG